MSVYSRDLTWPMLPLLVLGIASACGAGDAADEFADDSKPALETRGLAVTSCGSAADFDWVQVTDTAGNPVSSILPNTDYFVAVRTRAPATCITLTSGGALAGGGTHRCDDTPTDNPGASGGTKRYGVTSSSSSCLAGYITGGCGAPVYKLDFSLGSSCRRYLCGYALPGYNCDNGRTSVYIPAADMSAALAACPDTRALLKPAYTDSCYVIDSTGYSSLDASQCTGAWRSANNCCNLEGTLSCPAPPPPPPPECVDGQFINCTYPGGNGSGYKVCSGGHWGPCM